MNFIDIPVNETAMQCLLMEQNKKGVFKRPKSNREELIEALIGTANVFTDRMERFLNDIMKNFLMEIRYQPSIVKMKLSDLELVRITAPAKKM